jgi:glycosyltransferase involved in cell wall biosynthesis
MELADVVFVPSTFVERTVRQFLPDKKIALTPYGVDAEFWRPGPERSADGKLRFIYAGQISVRKGIPLLLEAWHKAAPSSATLDLVGPWQLNENRRLNLPPNVCHWPACSAEQLRARYQSADVFVFPSYFEGFGLVLLEAMACGLPVIGTEATAAPDIIDSTNGTVITTGDIESLIHALRSIADNRDELPRLKRGAREKAKHCSWEAYRKSVIQGTDQ